MDGLAVGVVMHYPTALSTIKFYYMNIYIYIYIYIYIWQLAESLMNVLLLLM